MNRFFVCLSAIGLSILAQRAAPAALVDLTLTDAAYRIDYAFAYLGKTYTGKATLPINGVVKADITNSILDANSFSILSLDGKMPDTIISQPLDDGSVLNVNFLKLQANAFSSSLPLVPSPFPIGVNGAFKQDGTFIDFIGGTLGVSATGPLGSALGGNVTLHDFSSNPVLVGTPTGWLSEARADYLNPNHVQFKIVPTSNLPALSFNLAKNTKLTLNLVGEFPAVGTIAVPEPDTWLLGIIAGSFGIAVMAFRRGLSRYLVI